MLSHGGIDHDLGWQKKASRGIELYVFNDFKISLSNLYKRDEIGQYKIFC